MATPWGRVDPTWAHFPGGGLARGTPLARQGRPYRGEALGGASVLRAAEGSGLLSHPSGITVCTRTVWIRRSPGPGFGHHG